jgi:hypothetical protein
MCVAERVLLIAAEFKAMLKMEGANWREVATYSLVQFFSER